MAERSSISQTIQIGMETVPGTAVAATKRFKTVSIEPTTTTTIDTFRPAGSKYNALTALSKEHTTAPVTGRGSYTEIIYPLASVLRKPTITTPPGATLGRKFTFDSADGSEDDVQTYTIEHGSNVHADRFSYGVFTEFGMTFNRNAVELTGSLIGRAIEDDITMTSAGSITPIPLIPILATQVSVYADPEAADVGTTKLSRVVSAAFSLTNKSVPLWILDASLDSYVTHIETAPEVTFTLMVEADAEGMEFINKMRTAERTFFRVEGIGPEIEAATDNTFNLDISAEVSNMNGFSDQDGLYAAEFTFTAIIDDTWGKAFEFSVINALTAL
jgi:hypothetical protein